MLRSKTISSLVSMLFAQLILISLVGAQEMRLDLNDSFEPLGGIASMEITLDKGVAPVSAIAIDIGFDTQVLSNPGAMVDSQIGPGTSTDRQLISSLISSGVFRIAIIPASLTQASLGAVLPDGLVATVTFNISSLAAPGTVTIVTNTPSASTPAGQTLPTVGRDGVVTIVDNHVDIAPLYTTGNVLVGANYGNGPSSSGMTLIMRLAGDNVIYVDEGSPVKYVHNPDNQGAGNDWIERGFDDSGWADGTSGVGFSDSDDNTTVPAGLTSIWTRYQFDAPNAAAISELVLLADYGDQYIAWLNGVRIAASAGAPEGEPPAWDAAQDGVLVHAASGFAAGSPSESRWHSFDIEWTVVGFEFVEQLTERVLSLTSAEASPGEQVTVQLSISDATGLASGDILIEYNSSIVTVREIRSADLISEEDFVANKDVLGDLRFSIARAEGLPPGSGALANIEL